MTARDDAIEAAARASYETYRAARPDLNLREWEHAEPFMRRSEIGEVAKHYDAMAPLIRQACAEEIAQQIEQDAATWHNAEGISAHEHKTFRAAARRVREIGGAS